MPFDYKLVFEKIESSIFNNMNISISEFQKRISPFKETIFWDFRNRSDNNIFWVLSYIVFFGQKDPSFLIESKFDEINQLLCGGLDNNWIEWEVDFLKLSKLSIDEKNMYITKNLKWGRWGDIRDTDFSGKKIIGVNRYLKWILKNAIIFSDLIKKNNSFKEYIKIKMGINDLDKIDLSKYDYKNPAVRGLFKELKERFYGFGDRTTYHFLGDIGFNVNKPDKVVCRILNRLGLISNNDQENALAHVNKFASETGNITRYIDIILVKYGQKGDSPLLGTKSGICADIPRCIMCEAKQYCSFGESKG